MTREQLLLTSEKFGTPTYVYDAEKIRYQYKRLENAFDKLPVKLQNTYRPWYGWVKRVAFVREANRVHISILTQQQREKKEKGTNSCNLEKKFAAM